MTQELLTEASIPRYVDRHGLLPKVTGKGVDGVEVQNLSSGNMNRVFRARGDAGSVIVKQAPPFVSSVGEEAPADPSRILVEAGAYRLMAETIASVIPNVYLVDADNFVLVMEDLADFEVLRYHLVGEVESAGRTRSQAFPATIDIPGVGASVGAALGRLTRATEASAFSAGTFQEFAEAHANPELCEVTHKYVLEYPYSDTPVNRWIPELEADAHSLHSDLRVRSRVSEIRQIFDEKKEALLHGDLHTGSIMVRSSGGDDKATAIKLFDPEFSFVGPIGFDLGLVWVNLYIAAIAARVRHLEVLAAQRLAAAERSWEAFRQEWAAASPELLDEIQADAWQFAGVEAMRRVVGSAHIEDLTTLNGRAEVDANRAVFDLARALIVDGRSLSHADVKGISGL